MRGIIAGDAGNGVSHVYRVDIMDGRGHETL